MASVKTNAEIPAWVTFFGTLFILIGIFFSTRTLVNLFMFEKYPMVPSTSLVGLVGTSQTGYDEASCPAGDTECPRIFRESRQGAMITDITNSLFFLFLGAGIMYTRKRLYGVKN